ncbi:hypothetical protein D4765_19045 [Subtercola vilae]|uniref:Uncharacterized protein n=1 Tax=Subtercola vilae TaxID=2056433 RepID=A0A4T2B9K0_9MICO|nr:hypothetical protein D4765_19045 [Subtercola vilae]
MGLRVFVGLSGPQAGLWNSVLVGATVLLTVPAILVTFFTLMKRRGRKIAVALAALRVAHSKELVFAGGVEQGFWLALRRLRADVENEGPGPWPIGSFHGNFVCAVVDDHALTYWSVDPVPVLFVSIPVGQIADVSIGSVPAGLTFRTGLILTIKRATSYRLTALIEDEARLGYPANSAAIQPIANALRKSKD